MDFGSVLAQAGFINERELAALRRKGAVGDVLGRFIDTEGAIVDAALDARTIGLDPRPAATSLMPSRLRRARRNAPRSWPH